jgi:peroxiredoxin
MSRMRQCDSAARPRVVASLPWMLALLLASAIGCGQRPSTGADPKTAELLGQAVASIGQHERFRVLIDFAMLTIDHGEKTETKTTHILSVERPNRLVLWPQGEEKGVFIVSDGEQFSRGNSISKKYVVSPSPSTLQDIVYDFAGDFELGMGGLFFVSQEQYELLIAEIPDLSDLGVEEIDGHPCQHLRHAGSHDGFDVWLEQTTPPLIRKAVIDFDRITIDEIVADGVISRSIQFGGDVPETGGQTTSAVTGSMSLVYRYRDWEFDPTFSAGLFAFVPPDDWEQVDQLADTTPEVEEPPHPLLGKIAPDFELPMRSGEIATVSQHRDKEVVILDFWATWCGPCRESLPAIAKVAADYRDRGVVFYAINLEESPDEVEQVLADLQLDIPVIFDHDFAVGKRYFAKTIPQTVLIGKDGVVHVVHIGLESDCEELLSRQLDDLLAGRDLAAPSDASAEDQTPGEGYLKDGDVNGEGMEGESKDTEVEDSKL